MFLRLDGIDGDATDSTHADEIEVLALDWGGVCRSPGNTKARFMPVVISKQADRATPLTLQAAATGQKIASGELSVRKPGGDALEYLVIQFNDIEILSGGNQLTFSYDAIKVIHTPQLDDGTGGPEVGKGWDVGGNLAWEP